MLLGQGHDLRSHLKLLPEEEPAVKITPFVVLKLKAGLAVES